MPISDAFQEVGNAIRADDFRLAQIDVSLPGFLAREDLLLVELPLQRILLEAAVPREETASSYLSLKVEINRFHFEEDKKERVDPIIQLPDSEDELDKHSVAHSPRLIVVHVNPSFEEDKEMDINPRRGLKGLLAVRNKRASSKKVHKSQVPTNLPPPPPILVTTVGLLPYPDLKKKKKKRKWQKVEEGKVVPPKGAKQRIVGRTPLGPRCADSSALGLLS